MTEILFDLRKNGALVTSKAVIAALLLASIYNVLSFSASTESAIDTQFGESNDRNLFSITDSVIDSDEFERTRQDPAAIGRVASFYNAMNADDSYELLSAFDQPIPLANFPGGDQFDAWRQISPDSGGEYLDPNTGDPTVDVLAMQLNKKAFAFYGLSVEEGDGLPWETVDYSTGEAPVLLGSNYRGIYAIGDRLQGNFYSAPITMTVVGFLEPNSSMFYKRESGFYLDDYIVMAYPPRLEQPTSENITFAGILAFAMINADIAAPRSMSSDDVIGAVHAAAQRAGFEDYAFIDVPQYLTQYSLTRNLLLENKRLVTSLLGAITVSAALVMRAAARAIARRRATALRVRWILGETQSQIWGSLALMVAADWAISAVLFAMLYRTLASSGSAVALVAVGCMAAFAVFDAAQSLVVARKEIARG